VQVKQQRSNAPSKEPSKQQSEAEQSKLISNRSRMQSGKEVES
jgi:hypothetical protein